MTAQVAFAFSVNYVIGLGVLSMPYAVSNSGIALSIIALLFATFLCLLTAFFLFEVLARAEGLKLDGFTGVDHSDIGVRTIFEEPRVKITYRKFEINELCHFFFGTPPKKKFLTRRETLQPPLHRPRFYLPHRRPLGLRGRLVKHFYGLCPSARHHNVQPMVPPPSHCSEGSVAKILSLRMFLRNVCMPT